MYLRAGLWSGTVVERVLNFPHWNQYMSRVCPTMLPSVKAASHTHTPSLPPSLPCAHTHRLALQKHGSSLVIDQNITTYRLSCQALTWSHNTSRIFQFFLSFSLSFHPFVRSGSSLHYLQLYFPYLSLKSIFLFLTHPLFACGYESYCSAKPKGRCC